MSKHFNFSWMLWISSGNEFFLIRRFISCPCLGQSEMHKETFHRNALGHRPAGENDPGRFFHHMRSSSWTSSWVQFSFSEVHPGTTAVLDNISSWLWLKINKIKHFRAPGRHLSNHVRSWGPKNPLFVLQVSCHGKAASSRLSVEASQEIPYLC